MADTSQFKCPCCGGPIEFNAAVQMLKCPYCETEFELDTLQGYDDDLKKNEEAQDDMTWQGPEGTWTDADGEMNLYHCTSCGAEVVCEATTSATSCPYCGNPVVIKGKLAGDLKPDYIIPFKYDKNQAKETFKKFMTGKKLLPKVFSDENHIDEIKGMYVPYWIFDGDTQADILYDGTKVRQWSDADYNYVETSHYLISRGGTLSFENIPADGSSKMPDDLMESLEPFDMKDAMDFQTAYLAGYIADRYDVTSEECEPRISERAKNTTESTFRNTVQGYNTVEVRSSSVQLLNSRILYVLLPIWLLNTSWNGQQFTFAMNGQTGKFVGDLPTDKSAYRKYFFLIFLITAAVIIGIGLLTYFL